MQIFENNVDLFTADKLLVSLKKKIKESKLWDYHHDHEPVRSIVASSVHTFRVCSPAKCFEPTHTAWICREQPISHDHDDPTTSLESRAFIENW